MKKLYIFGFLLLLATIVISVNVVRSQGNQGCQANLDVVLAIDRSSSMGYTSKCDWWQLKCNNYPSCSQGYTWVLNTTYNETQASCIAKNQSSPHESVWIEYNPQRMGSVKSAAKNFIAKLDDDDQSALVSFASTATLDKTLDNNHPTTQSKVDSLTTGGGSATNIGDAIKFSNQELASARADAQATKVMILLTDGKANKPNGTGTGENSADVTYALTKATEAAASGIKIYTIGLGPDVNAAMLQQIAASTGGQYYAAPSSAEIEVIYKQIGNTLCPSKVGSISGCKYNDDNNDGDITGETTTPEWEIELQGPSATSTKTDQTGCYTFSGLSEGSYIVNEKIKDGWVQTYPSSRNYTLDISGNDIQNIDFGNYFPACGNGIIDSGEQCDDHNTANGDGCSASCTIEVNSGKDGISCWDLNGNRINDPEEDINHDGRFDALDCKGLQGDTGPEGPAGKSLKVIDADNTEVGILIDVIDTNKWRVWNSLLKTVEVDSQGKYTIPNIPDLFYLQHDCQGTSYVRVNSDIENYGFFMLTFPSPQNIRYFKLGSLYEDWVTSSWNANSDYPQGHCSNFTLPGMFFKLGELSPVEPPNYVPPLSIVSAEDTVRGLSCWDLNKNGVGDTAEDINQDGNFDTLDCKGSKGEEGPRGPSGTSLKLVDSENNIIGLILNIYEPSYYNAYYFSENGDMQINLRPSKGIFTKAIVFSDLLKVPLEYRLRDGNLIYNNEFMQFVQTLHFTTDDCTGDSYVVDLDSPYILSFHDTTNEKFKAGSWDDIVTNPILNSQKFLNSTSTCESVVVTPKIAAKVNRVTLPNYIAPLSITEQ